MSAAAPGAEARGQDAGVARGPMPGPGRLRVFFGHGAGLGRRRALLRAALATRAAGTDLIVGAFDSEGDSELNRGLGRLEWIGGGAEPGVRDLDVPAVLARRPEVLVVAPLAHRNGSGADHRYRHQDVQALRRAGVDVWTTLEVREVASLAGLCERITGLPVEVRVPDDLLDEADRVEFLDGPVEGQAAGARAQGLTRAAQAALREMALRRLADRHRRGSGDPGRSGDDRVRAASAERLLACVGPSPSSERVVETAARMATAMGAQWTAIHVRSRAHGRNPGGGQVAAGHLRRAEHLGAEVQALDSPDVAEEILHFARSHGVTKILIGKTGRTLRSALLRGSIVDRVLAQCDDIDVYVVRASDDADSRRVRRPRPPSLLRVGVLAASLLVATALSFLFPPGLHADAGRTLTYLLAVTFVAASQGLGPAIAASFASVLLFNFFFTEPRYTLTVRDAHYLFTFAVMLVIGILVSTLMARVREHSSAARVRERRTEVLYHLGRRLSGVTGQRQILATAAEHLSGTLRARVSFWLPDGHGGFEPVLPAPPVVPSAPGTAVAVQVAGRERCPAGAGTSLCAQAPALCLPLAGPEGVEGVLAVERSMGPLPPDERRHLETLAAQVAMAIAGDRLAQSAHRAVAEAEAEKLRSTLLSSVSHDLRTPLAAISGASSTLLVTGGRIARAEREDLLRSITDEANRLARVIDNLLHLTRIESGRFPLAAEWQVVEDLVGSALHRCAEILTRHVVRTNLAPSLPLVRVDGVLVEVALVNLFENAARFAPPATRVEVSAQVAEERLILRVADEGPGVPDAEKARVFDKFYRGNHGAAGQPRGSGLGLAIAHAIATLHRGGLWVEDRPGGGACFHLALPVEPQPPALDGGADEDQGVP